MNLTLHLTEDCNMNCAYCTREKSHQTMSDTVMKAACDLAFSNGTTAGICFFGGEPLLCKPQIYTALDYCKSLEQKTGIPFQCKMTTNGSGLDEAFLKRAKEVNMGIGLSFEGSAQDICRRFADGRPTFEAVREKAALLLQYLPDSIAMMTIAPQAVHLFADAVRSLLGMSFHVINATIAFGSKVTWTDETFAVLEAQMREIAAEYEARFLRHEPFYFSPFDSKIRECIKGYNPAERCHLGFRQMPVAVNGNLYACTQFIGDSDYCIGNVFDGIDVQKQMMLASKAATPDSCKECALRTRCTNSCGCLNRLETGNAQTVSPLLCSYERMVIELADEIGERLYAADSAYFKRRYSK